MTLLRDRFRIVSLEATTASDSEPCVLITFDDGYRDNFETAWPILKSLSVPAVFFIATEFIEQPRLPWWDHVARVIKQTEATRIVLDEPEPWTIDLEQRTRTEAIATLINRVLDRRLNYDDRFRAHIESRAGVTFDESALGRALFMSWDQIRTLAEAGMAIGSHTHGHRWLAWLTQADQRFELAESKRILEERLHRPVEALAYPYGWAGTYDELTRRLAREAGYRLAFSGQDGINRPDQSDAWELRRVAIGFSDSPEMVRARSALFSSFGSSFV
jgi:peptidoglycan/xylan/chitin deacetylase (PgdA/CDA1 family)